MFLQFEIQRWITKVAARGTTEHHPYPLGEPNNIYDKPYDKVPQYESRGIIENAPNQPASLAQLLNFQNHKAYWSLGRKPPQRLPNGTSK